MSTKLRITVQDIQVRARRFRIADFLWMFLLFLLAGLVPISGGMGTGGRGLILTPRQDRTLVSPDRQQNGSISGVVLGKQGIPAVGVRVAALAVSEGIKGEVALYGLTESAQDGAYHLDNVPPGRYYIVAGPMNLPTYYPDSNSTDGATVVVIGAATRLVGYNLRIDGVTVSGKIVNMPEEWKPLGKFAALFDPKSGTRSVLRTVLAEDGSFSFLKTTPGTFRLAIDGLAFGKATPWAPTVIVGASDISDITLDLQNNPFPDYPGGSHFAVFDLDSKVALRGVITQSLVQFTPRNPARYFRMDVSEGGVISSWAVIAFFTDLPNTTSFQADTDAITVGTSMTVSGSVARDGTHRMYLDGKGPILTRIVINR